MAAITIRHTRDDGTLIDGSTTGDGVYELLHAQHPHWRYMRTIGRIGLLGSRDRAAKRWMIDGAASVLREAGHEVTVEIDDTPTRTVAEVEADRYAAAEARADRLTAKASRLTSEADARREVADRITQGYAGTPILVGHYSEGRHRRDLEKADRNTRRSIELREESRHYEHRAEAAADYQAGRENIPTTLRRIERLEADRRRIAKQLAATENTEWAQRLTVDLADLDDELSYWRQHVATAQANGVKVWGRADFTVGDFVCHGSRWYEVVRVNAKSLTVPAAMNDGQVITAADSRYTWTDKLPYDKVTGRMSALDMAARIAAASPTTNEPEEG